VLGVVDLPTTNEWGAQSSSVVTQQCAFTLFMPAPPPYSLEEEPAMDEWTPNATTMVSDHAHLSVMHSTRRVLPLPGRCLVHPLSRAEGAMRSGRKVGHLILPDAH